jgi:hypothetical protein
VDDPTRHLVEPRSVDVAAENGYANPFNVLDLVSPTAWVNYGIKELTGVDILESLVKPFAGDWAAYSRFGNALRNLSLCCHDIAVNLQRELDIADRSWEGRANDAAFNYFCDLASKISQLRLIIYEAGNEYQRAATGMWQLAQQLANVLQAIVDEFFIISAMLAVGTALIETGIGVIAGYGLAAWRIGKLTSLIAKASAIVNTGGTIIMSFFSFLIEADRRLADVNLVGIPDRPYDHPEVDWRTA